MAGANIAVVGATGAVGRVVLSILEERGFPVERAKLLASSRSAGTIASTSASVPCFRVRLPRGCWRSCRVEA